MSTSPSIDSATMGMNFAAQTAINNAVFGLLSNIPFANNELVKIGIITALPKITTAAFYPLEKLYQLGMAILSWLFITQLWGWVMVLYYWFRSEPVQKRFDITIAHMNADSQPNLLHEAMMWFIASRSKEEREQAEKLEYFALKPQNSISAVQPKDGPQAPAPTKEEMAKKLLRTIPQSQSSSFFWKEDKMPDVRVHFSFETSVVDKPGSEKGKKVEIRKVNLWRWHTDAKNDLSEWFNGVFSEVLRLYDESKRSQVFKQQTFVNSRNGTWEPLRNSNTRSLETTILKEHQTARVRNILDKFTDDAEIAFAKKVGRPHKVTFLLKGPPGCGKTTLQQAVSSQLKRHLYYLNLSNVDSNEKLVQLLEKIDNATSVVVLEEIDVATNAVLRRDLRDQIEAEAKLKSEAKNFDGEPQQPQPMMSRQARDQGNGNGGSTLNLEGMLNFLQGNLSLDKLIVFMTTNCPEKLDPALIRPGRVDIDMVLDQCDFYQIQRLFGLYYEDRFDEEAAQAIEVIYNEMREKKGDDFISPTPCQLDNLLAQFRDNVERGLESFRQLLEDPTREIFVPSNKTRKQAKQ